MPSGSAKAGALKALRVTSGGAEHRITAAPDTTRMPEAQLVGQLTDLLAGGDEFSRRHDMHALLFGNAEPETTSGFIDAYAYQIVSGGWWLLGWISRGWGDGAKLEDVMLCFEEGDIGGEAFGVLYPRTDLDEEADGVACFVRGDARPLGRLCSLSFAASGLTATLYTAANSARLTESDMQTRLRPILAQALPGRQREALFGLLARQAFRGEDTLAALSSPVFIEIDEAILAGDDGLVLVGWCLAWRGAIQQIRLRSGALAMPVEFETAIRIDRPDVLARYASHGFTDPRCGFILFLPHNAIPAGSALYFEVETPLQEVGYRTLPRPRLEGLAAIRTLLASAEIRFDQVPPAFDRVLGPAIEGLNKARLSRRPETRVVSYGKAPARPKFSVIVRLHDRLDYAEYQLALFSAHPGCAGIDFIYVLDDPGKTNEAQSLFASIRERFLIPFKVVFVDGQVGSAVSANLGLAQARGGQVAFLESGIFPGPPDWLERLAARLDADPTLGAIAPVLLSEDGAIRQRGLSFRRNDEYGGWFCPMKQDQGRRPDGKTGLSEHPAIGGACIMLPRALARELGGFDETYIMHDYAASDLCLRLQQRGYRCGVDTEVALFQLQPAAPTESERVWRTNLTLYDAWQHERRWSTLIAARQKTA